MKTHYDNLKVTQSAPPEVIRAAYRALSQKHHPDRNGNSSESQRIMKIINESYAALSDPETRKRHDEWIASQRQTSKAEQAKPEAPLGFIPLNQFARLKDIPEAKVIQMVRDGFYAGRKLGDDWFISIEEVDEFKGRKRKQKTPQHADQAEPKNTLGILVGSMIVTGTLAGGALGREHFILASLGAFILFGFLGSMVYVIGKIFRKK